MLDPEPVTLPNLLGRRGGAQLCLLDAAARDADEVVMVAGVAANVGRPVVSNERAYRARVAQQVESAIGRREPEAGVQRACAPMELDRGEAAIHPLERPDDGATRGGRANARR